MWCFVNSSRYLQKRSSDIGTDSVKESYYKKRYRNYTSNLYTEELYEVLSTLLKEWDGG